MPIKTIAEIENDLTCRFCKCPLESNQYRFCDSIACQGLYIRLIERRISMRHSFNISVLDPFTCATCKRDMKAHGSKAQCETCENIGTCELVDDVLMCSSCEDKHLRARKELTENVNAPLLNERKEITSLLSTNIDLNNPTQAQIDKITRDSQELLRRAKEIDNNLLYAGHFFNAQTVAIEDLRRAIEGNSLIPPEHKSKELQLAIQQRLIHFQEKIFKADQEKFEAVQMAAACKMSLREFGNDILKEIREQLEKSDTTYVISKPVKAKVASKKAKKDPYEMLVDSLMSMHGCNRNEALKMMVDHNLLNRTKKEDA